MPQEIVHKPEGVHRHEVVTFEESQLGEIDQKDVQGDESVTAVQITTASDRAA